MKFSRFLASRDVIKQKNLYNIKQAKALLKPTGKPAIARSAAKKEASNAPRETATDALPPYASQGQINPALIDTERKMMAYLRKKDDYTAEMQKKSSNTAKSGDADKEVFQDNIENKGHTDNSLGVPYEGSSKAGEKTSKLLDELANSGVKYNSNDVVAITKTVDGKLVWLEKGNAQAGLEHIMNHADDFAAKGIARTEIKDLVMTALEKGQIVGHQGKGTGRPIYEVIFKGEKQRIAITVGNNGFVVGTNPQSLL